MILYRPTTALRREDRVPGVLHVQNARESMWLVPVEVEAEHIQDSARTRTKTVYVTPWTADDPHSDAQ